MKHIIIVNSSSESDVPVYEFDNEKKAKAYLGWLYERECEESVKNNLLTKDDINDANKCYRGTDYAIIEYPDGDKLEFIYSFVSDYKDTLNMYNPPFDENNLDQYL